MDNLELISLNGLHFRIDYEEFAYENRYPATNTLVWKSVKGKSMTGLEEGFEVTEIVTVIMTTPNKFLISWVEKTGLGVTQFLDLENKTIHSIIRNGNNLSTEKGDITLLSC